jgi:TatD DNase family protein
MQIIDTHCHLHFNDYLPDVEQVINDAHGHSVNKMICVGVSLEDSQKAVDFANKYENIWATVGAHPHDGADFLEHATPIEILEQLTKNEKVVAIGEIGLDYFHEYTPREKQLEVLSKQLEFGKECGLPFVFHVRDAWQDFWDILDAYKGIRGVVHCFSTHEDQLEEILKRGLYVGLNGIMTFTKDDKQLEAAKKVPLDKLLLETDAPFLTPKPFRGKRCEPKHITLTAEFLSTLRNEKLEDLTKASTGNAEALFKI